MIGLKRLRDSESGATMVEFALVAPVFLAMIFGVIETSRVFWIKQTLDEVAYSTARCMSVSSTCDTTSAQKTYAVDRATGYAVKIVASDVVPAAGTTCKGVGNSNAVTITKVIDSPLGGFVPQMPSILTATACFPSLA